MQALKARLSAKNLASLEPGQLGWDTEISGFGGRMAQDGKVTLFLNYMVKGTGRYRRVTICKLPELSVDAARKRAAEMKVNVRAGADPAATVETVKPAADNTLEHHVNRWLADTRHKWSDKTRAAYTRAMRRELFGTDVAGMDIADVKRAHLMRLVDAVAERSSSSTALFFAALSSFLGWADDRGLTEATLPRASRAAPSPAPRTRVMSDAEIASLWHATAQVRADVAYMGRIVLLTGQRSGAVQRLEPEWVTQAGIDWPAEVMKSGRDHHTALSSWAYEQLRDTPVSLASTALANHWPNWRKAAGLDADLRMHDVRRSLRTWAARAGHSHDASEAALAHTVQKDALARAYQQHDYKDEAAEVLRGWQRHVEGLVA